MITPVSNKADLLTSPARGGEPDHAAAKTPTAARTQPDSDKTAPFNTDRASLDHAVAKVSEVLKTTDLKLEVDDATDRVVVKVVKEDSGEVIRQFPPKEVLALAKYLSTSNKGALLEEQA